MYGLMLNFYPWFAATGFQRLGKDAGYSILTAVERFGTFRE